MRIGSMISIHSSTNSRSGILRPKGAEDIQQHFRQDIRSQYVGRHAMGGQQFGTDTWLADTSSLNGVLISIKRMEFWK